MLEAHSRYGASSMSRWSVCPGSVTLLEKHPTTTSMAASEGTLAHDMAERKLLARIAGEEVPVCADLDMEDYINGYVDYCMDLYAQNLGGYAVEGKFHLDHIEAEHGEVFGTNDFSCWTDLEILHIVDLKYGKHKVKAVDNKQLMFYALGCMHQYKIDPVLIYLHIYQPRASKRKPYDVHEISIGELINFEAELRKAIKRVDEEPEVRIAGGHCFFCSRAHCPEAQEKQLGRRPKVEDTITFNTGNK